MSLKNIILLTGGWIFLVNSHEHLPPQASASDKAREWNNGNLTAAGRELLNWGTCPLPKSEEKPTNPTKKENLSLARIM